MGWVLRRRTVTLTHNGLNALHQKVSKFSVEICFLAS